LLVSRSGLRTRLGIGSAPQAYIPDAPQGAVHLETLDSAARGTDVQLFTAVPEGHGDGEGLPVCLVLHGASATPADFEDFGFGRFLTAAVRAGADPFVLAGASGGQLSWEVGHVPGDDPARMLVEEMPRWLADRGFDSTRLVAWGWSMGGYGALRLAQAQPSMLRGVAAFSPAITEGDLVFGDVDALGDQPVGLWCGTDDGFVDAVRALGDALPVPADPEVYAQGRHTRVFWNDHTLEALAALAGWLRADLSDAPGVRQQSRKESGCYPSAVASTRRTARGVLDRGRTEHPRAPCRSHRRHDRHRVGAGDRGEPRCCRTGCGGGAGSPPQRGRPAGRRRPCRRLRQCVHAPHQRADR